jgi:hypothetical protein
MAFSLTREETVTLAERLTRAGVDRADIARYVGISPTKVREIVQTLTFAAENGQSWQGRNGNQVTGAGDRSSAEAKPSDRLIRACAACGEPLPSSVRVHARYCPGGRCKMAASRARRAA